MDATYTPPTALTILSGIFLILGAICALVIVGDIVWRRGWRNMMWIMIPVYPINAAYMLPVTLYVYFKYGRPTRPTPKNAVSHAEEGVTHCHDRSMKEADLRSDSETSPTEYHAPREAKHETTQAAYDRTTPPSCNADLHTTDPAESRNGRSSSSEAEEAKPTDSSMAHCHHHGITSRPMWATVLIGVSHCGAGCVLGDLVGEWLVYGTNATINGESIWVELLVDYAFALLFGIMFQYFSIAPMSGEYGPKSLWRAAKADILSLTSFEVGAFGWMIAYQVDIFGYRLSMTTWTYWWMMQIGMALGFATAMPVNWYLISKGIKEPCA